MRRTAFPYLRTAWLDRRPHTGILKIFRPLCARPGSLPAEDRLGSIYRWRIRYRRDIRCPAKTRPLSRGGRFCRAAPPAGGRHHTIVDILPQKSVFTRGTSGREGTDQVIAANIDTVFIVTAPAMISTPQDRAVPGDRPRIRRKTRDRDQQIRSCRGPRLAHGEIIPVSSGIPVIPVSAMSGEGITGSKRSFPRAQRSSSSVPPVSASQR